MPHTCCVATCRGNYATGPKVGVFRFPKQDDLLKRWLWNIKREDGFQPKEHSRVCELHFRPEDILRESRYFDERSGKVITAPLASPRLKEGAIPTLFPDGPQYLSSNPIVRGSPEKKKQKKESDAINQAIEASLLEKSNYDKKYLFSNLNELELRLSKQSLPENWSVIHKPLHSVFINVCIDVCPYIQKSLLIDSNLNTSAFLKSIPIKVINQVSIPSKISDINVLFDFLQKFDSPEQNFPETNVANHLETIKKLLNDLKNVFSDKEQEINFIIEQLNNFNKKTQQYRYSAELLIFYTLLYSISPHAYKFLRSSQNIIMPHPRTIFSICSNVIVNPVTEQFGPNFLNYSKLRFNDLSEKDLQVVLLMDEIHLNRYFDYKGGNLCGMAYNNKNPASSAYVFMIRSLLSTFKDVVHILPVNTLSATILYDYIKKIIIGLEEIGFRIVAVISDNNSINKKAMSLFSDPPKSSILYKNPFDPSRPLFFILDSVHIIKCIRNNWINQKTAEQSLFYPNFDNTTETVTASFQCLKKLHELETGKLLKYGYGLSIKALYPTNLEKQNVKLALQIFNPQVAEALICLGEKDKIKNFKETGEFIKIINTWWSIVNVKSNFKGVHKNDIYQTPFTIKDTDQKYIFMNKLLFWLEDWKKLGLKAGCLTTETHFALDHTTFALTEMARYCIEELKFSYILPGKIQTDPLEYRFGKYRRLAGSQHNISIRQVYEIEGKLRLQAMLPSLIKSKKYGEIPICITDGDNKDEAPIKENEIEKYCEIITVEDDDIDAIQSELPLLAYIAGYCCYTLIKKLKCDQCRLNITLDKKFILEEVHSWIKTFDRGLMYPHPDVLNAVVYNFIIIKKFTSEYEKEFLFSPNQRDLAVEVTLNVLRENLFFLELNDCPNSHDPSIVLKLIIKCSTNILLNNYCKKMNDNLSDVKNLAKQRKLKTLQKK